ncbi:hypothetical protein [Phreatobacter sp.]|uniref:hypothetical protein n=1 Tax=Phreatobacter sp. TaxID=1966341 RepID=UPI003F6FD9E4
MRKFVWIAAITGTAVWSLVALVGWAIVSFLLGEVAASGTAPGFTPEPMTFAWFAGKVQTLGGLAILGGWLVGVALMLGTALLVSRIAGRRDPRLNVRPRGQGASYPSTFPGPGGPPAGGSARR